MSKNIVEITQSNSISKDSLPKEEITPFRNMSNLKGLFGAKKIVITSLLIFLFVALFISCAYIISSRKAKRPININALTNEKRRVPIEETINNELDGDSNSRNVQFRSVQDTTPGSGYERNVLLITNYISKHGNWQNKVSPDVLYNILKGINKVTLSVLDPYDADLNTKGLNYLKSFHLVVIDFVDGGYNLSPRCPMFVRALMQYIKEGGALFSCHDQFDDTHSRFITQEALEMLQLLGLKHANSHGKDGIAAFFDQTAISNTFFVANHAIDGDGFNIASTHQTYSRFDDACTTCKVIMKFSPNGPNSDEYLVTNRPFKGKTLNIRAGHTQGFTEPEKKVFLSSILWLLYDI